MGAPDKGVILLDNDGNSTGTSSVPWKKVEPPLLRRLFWFAYRLAFPLADMPAERILKGRTICFFDSSRIFCFARTRTRIGSDGSCVCPRHARICFDTRNFCCGSSN